MKNGMLTPASTSKAKPKHKAKAHARPPAKPAENVTPKDMAFDRNFTKAGKPKLNATSGDGSMGGRR